MSLAFDAERFAGRAMGPGDEGFDEARQVWNAMIDCVPSLIVQCAGIDDVRRAIELGRSREWPVAIRGGGHSIAGLSTCDGGLVIDLRAMNAISVDAAAKRARAQGGARWGQLDAAMAPHGLATTGGVISTTGIAGLTLGGGIGYLMRSFGLACDRVEQFDVVTAAGDQVVANATENPELYWGLRGGGGNFGIVTDFTYRLGTLNPTVLAGMVTYPLKKAKEVLRFFREFTEQAPDELTTYMTLSPGGVDRDPVAALAFCYTGSIAEGERLLAPTKTFCTPTEYLVEPMPYVTFQSMNDEANPSGLQNYWKSHFLHGLPEECIDVVVDEFGRKPLPAGNCPRGGLIIEHMGGAVARVPDDATVVGNRSAPYSVEMISIWDDPADTAAQVEWARTTWSVLAPFATGGAYVNYLAETGPEAVAAAFGTEKMARLVALKDAYDPENYFRLNHNIVPSALRPAVAS